MKKNTDKKESKQPKDIKSKIKNLETRNTELEKALEGEKELRLRALADYQNLQRRVEEEREKLTLLANIGLLTQLLDILDDFNRALEYGNSSKQSQEDKSIVDGLVALKNKLETILENMGVVEIRVSRGDEFNSNYHEAIGTVKSEDPDNIGKILEIAQKGYMVKDKDNEIILRHARVIVGN